MLYVIFIEKECVCGTLANRGYSKKYREKHPDITFEEYSTNRELHWYKQTFGGTNSDIEYIQELLNRNLIRVKDGILHKS